MIICDAPRSQPFGERAAKPESCRLSSSPNSVGFVIAEVLGLDAGSEHKKDERTAAQHIARAKVRSLLSGWLQSGERRIAVGKELANRAQALRTSKVNQVFNDELNSVWRELFIRLAPEEAFVPAFALPKTSNGSVEAVLETLYR